MLYNVLVWRNYEQKTRRRHLKSICNVYVHFSPLPRLSGLRLLLLRFHFPLLSSGCGGGFKAWADKLIPPRRMQEGGVPLNSVIAQRRGKAPVISFCGSRQVYRARLTSLNIHKTTYSLPFMKHHPKVCSPSPVFATFVPAAPISICIPPSSPHYQRVLSLWRRR